jgi:osmotically-inducible protein OsmY
MPNPNTKQPQPNERSDHGQGGSPVDNRVPGQDTIDTQRLAGQGARDRGAGHVPHLGLDQKPTTRSDNDLLTEACDKIAQVPGIDLDAVDVSIREGGITLRGSVPTLTDKLALSEMVWGIEGVRDVRNEIQVASIRRSA